ncbi:hypothetical protein NYR55_12300 [Sphingomonas sp. BGYR3]|uniref:hypothetical protein n=1 Tax=Sphingomonas sp. BGYR3 TaxID=2975483 RepID=UPI0021A768E7|nr:hypothetical protein [Sphingomonas sp. BGYR3]MDG5489397.1 hypothetical protein [Sphingomonas sp. BGYR3]
MPINLPAIVPFQIEGLAELATEIACFGAIAAADVMNDQIFESTVSITALIYEMYPG